MEKLLLRTLFLFVTAILFVNAISNRQYADREYKNFLRVFSLIKEDKKTAYHPYYNSIMSNNYARLRKGRISDIHCQKYILDMISRDIYDVNENVLLEPEVTIIGGQDAKIQEFPHMAGLRYYNHIRKEWNFKCGGSLISSKFVLTAAHCLYDKYDELKMVRLGQSNIKSDLSHLDVEISCKIIHPKYNYPRRYYDLALLKLKMEVKFTRFIQPACLWTNPSTMLLGNKANITGWGQYSKSSEETSSVLKEATVDILEPEECNKHIRRSVTWDGMHNDQICAGNLAGGKDTCPGDSGGPLQVKIPLPLTTQGTISYLIGVTSFGTRWGYPDSPGVYAKVYSAIDWIERTVWPQYI